MAIPSSPRDNIISDNNNENCITKKKIEGSEVTKLRGGIFMTSLAGFSMLFGFGATVVMAKRKDPAMFTKSLLGSREIPESGGALALRALAWGTAYSVTGFSLFCLAIWKLLGVRTMTEFREKMGLLMPQIPKNKRGKSDFESVQELIDHILEEDEKKKREKKT